MAITETPIADPFKGADTGAAASIATPTGPAPTAGATQPSGVTETPIGDPFTSTGEQIAAPLVSGMAGGLGQVVDLPALGFETTFIRPARELVNNVRSLVNADTNEQYLESLKYIRDHPWIQGYGKWGLEKAAEAVGLPTTETAPAQTESGRIGQHALETGTEFLTGGMFGKAAELLTNAPKVAGLIKELSQLVSPENPAGSAAIGATTGAVQQTAAEAGASPETQQLLGMATPMAAAAIPAAARAGLRTAGTPITGAQRTQMAQDQAVQAFVHEYGGGDAAQAAATIRQGLPEDIQRQQNLPGSPAATTAELLNDPKLLGLERQRRENSPEMAAEAAKREAASYNAQWQALQSMANPTTGAGATQQILRFYRTTLDNMFEQEAAAARAEAERTRQAAQPSMTPEQQGEAARRAIDAEHASLGQGLQQTLQDAGLNAQATREILGGIEPLSPEAGVEAWQRMGQAFREPAAAIDEAERQENRRFWEAIDPSGTMGMNKAAIGDVLAGIRRDFEPKWFSGREKQFYDHVDGWGDQIRLQDALRLRAAINSRLRMAEVEPAERLRLSRLKDGIDQATDDAAYNRRQEEVTAAAGSPTSTIGEGLLRTLDGLGPSTVGNFAEHVESDPTRLRQAMQDPLTAEILRRGAPNTAAAGEQILHPLDPATQQKIIEVTQRHRDWKQRFQSETGRSGQLHAVGKMLQKGGAYDEYNLPDGRVPALFIEGKDAPLAIDRFIAAVGPEIAGPVLEDAFKLSLRSQPGIRNSDGTMNLKAYNRWASPERQAALSRLPPDVLPKFQDAAAAQQRLEEAEEAFAQHEQDHPLKAGLIDSAILGRFWKTGPQGGELMRQYREMTGNRPEAFDAAVDYIAYDFAKSAIDNTGVVNKNRADTWLRQHALGLGQLPPEQRARFVDAATAQQTFEETLARHNQMRAEFDKSIAGVVLGTDTDKVAELLFKGSQGAQRASELVNIISKLHNWRPQDAYAALEGLQRSVIDYMHKEFGGPQPGKWAPDMAREFSNFIANNEPVFRKIFGDNGWNGLRMIGDDARRASLVADAKTAGGRNTAEILKGIGSGRNSSWIPYFKAYALEHLLTHGIHALSHLPLLGWLAYAGRQMAQNHLNVRADQILDHLLTHPEDAAEALEAVSNPRRSISNPTMGRYRWRLLQALILSSQQGHERDVRPDTLRLAPGQGYRVGGRVRLQGGGDVEPAPAAPPVDPADWQRPSWTRPATAAELEQPGRDAIQDPLGNLTSDPTGLVGQAKGIAYLPAAMQEHWDRLKQLEASGAPPEQIAEARRDYPAGNLLFSAAVPLAMRGLPAIGSLTGAPPIGDFLRSESGAARMRRPAGEPPAERTGAPTPEGETQPTTTAAPVEDTRSLADHLRDEHLARGDQALPLSGARMPVAPPPHIQTMDDVNGLVNRYVDLAQTGRMAKNWYLESGQAIARATNDLDTAGKFTSAIARTSPQTDVPSNLLHAITLHNQAMLGEPLRGGRFPEAMGSDVEKYYYGNDPVTGEKIAPFHNALDVGWNPDFPHTYVNDVWNMRALEYPGKEGKPFDESPTLGQHNFTRIIADRALDELDRRTGERWDPKELQAASWAAIKSRDEGQPLSVTAQNYATGLARNYAQASWESAPGIGTNHLPEFHTAPLQDRQAFHNDIRSVMVDDQGNDIIHRHLGLLTGQSFDAPGYFRGEAAPGTQAPVAVGQAPGGMKVGVDPASRMLLNVGEAVRGLILRQNAAAWLKPSYSASLATKNLNQANLADIRIGRPLTMDEAGAVGQEMQRITGSDFFSPIATQKGYRLYNVPAATGLTNRQFWGRVDQLVAAGVHPQVDTEIVHALADGNYIPNEWKENPGGENYIKEIRRTGRPDVLRAASELLATLGPRVSAVEDRWADTHGWTPNRATRVWETNPAIQQYAGATVPSPPRPWEQRPAPPSFRPTIFDPNGGRTAPGVGGGPGGSGGLGQAQRSAAEASGGQPPLVSLPVTPIDFGDGRYLVPGPLATAREAAQDYMQSAGLPYDPPRTYAKVDPERASRIAQAFDAMKHDPDDPAVKASYAAMVKETLAQWQAIKKTGLQVEWIKPHMEDPYAKNPRLAMLDVHQNNHWWGFPTDLGYGTDDPTARANNPMLQPTNEIVDGRRLLVNDVFRIVHDYFGHFKEGVGFRASGEENAWRSHAAMYSPLARGAMTSETRGQNSWVNYGPYGETNRTASAADTHYSEQKVGLLPDWVINEGRMDEPKIPAEQRPIPPRRFRGGAIPRSPAPPAGVFWRGGAIIPQATPHRFH